jgi:hypothetical protein
LLLKKCPAFYKCERIWGEKPNIKLPHIDSTTQIGMKGSENVNEEPGQPMICDISNEFESIPDENFTRENFRSRSRSRSPVSNWLSREENSSHAEVFSADESSQGSSFSQGLPRSPSVRSTQGTSHGSTQGTSHGSTQGTSHGSTQGTSHGSTQGTSHVSTQGTSHGSTQGTSHGSTQGTSHPGKRFDRAGCALAKVGKKETMKEMIDGIWTKRENIDTQRLKLQEKQFEMQLEQHQRQLKLDEERIKIERERSEAGIRLEAEKFEYAKLKDQQDLERERMNLRKRELDVEELKLKMSLGMPH